jgi:hypothetical protein
MNGILGDTTRPFVSKRTFVCCVQFPFTLVHVPLVIHFDKVQPFYLRRGERVLGRCELRLVAVM